MVHAFHHRVHGLGERGGESALRMTAVLIVTLLVIVILFLGVFVTRAV
jgi:hypothetical protein